MYNRFGYRQPETSGPFARPGGVIIDHDDDPLVRGTVHTGRCSTCLDPIDAHLSYGRRRAARSGGRPGDYIRPLRAF